MRPKGDRQGRRSDDRAWETDDCVWIIRALSCRPIPVGLSMHVPTGAAASLDLVRRRRNDKSKVVAITGASSGIGEAAALHLAQLGAKVVLGAMRTSSRPWRNASAGPAVRRPTFPSTSAWRGEKHRAKRHHASSRRSNGAPDGRLRWPFTADEPRRTRALASRDRGRRSTSCATRRARSRASARRPQMRSSRT